MLNTTLCHIEKDGKYLMLHRVKKKNDLNHDKWVGIGGKFEENESPEECNAREVLEETGLTIINAKYRCVVTFISDVWENELMHVFTSKAFTGTVKECNEGELVWIEKEKLYDLPIWEGDKIFLKLIEDEDYPFFSLKLVYEGDCLADARLNNKKIDFKEFL